MENEELTPQGYIYPDKVKSPFWEEDENDNEEQEDNVE